MKTKIVTLLLAALLALLLTSALAATVSERMDAVERELGIAYSDQPMNVRISQAEAALGIYAGDDLSIAERLEALERQLGIGGQSAPAVPPAPPAPVEEEIVLLDDLDHFSNTDVATGFIDAYGTDSYGGDHRTMLRPYLSDGEIEYLLNGEYRELRATVYIPRKSLSDLEASDLSRVRLVVYGDDKALYTLPKLGLKDEPIDISVDIRGVKFLKIAFAEDCISMNTLVVFGDAALVK